MLYPNILLFVLMNRGYRERETRYFRGKLSSLMLEYARASQWLESARVQHSPGVCANLFQNVVFLNAAPLH